MALAIREPTHVELKRQLAEGERLARLANVENRCNTAQETWRSWALVSRRRRSEGRATGFVFGCGESLSKRWQGGDQGFSVCDLPVAIELVFEAREGRGDGFRVSDLRSDDARSTPKDTAAGELSARGSQNGLPSGILLAARTQRVGG